MDDKTRFDQLEEIIVEMLHKQDRTIEDVGRLREAVAAQQVTLVHMQNDINRIEADVAVVRRLATDTARVLNKSVAELTAANERNNQLLQDTAVILAENRLFQEETRQALAENRQALAENRQALADTRTTLDQIVALLTKP
ncbi:MAG: hypothetical protein EOO57_16050 [Hymenobacter sp.]|nr:MAG: hypothetical protein EOO57_16050 [Hymenobacter sp.]